MEAPVARELGMECGGEDPALADGDGVSVRVAGQHLDVGTRRRSPAGRG